MFKHLPLNTLRAFEATARLGEVKLAAAELFVTPAAVSQQLKKLEVQLQLNVWERHANKIVLTPLGRQLYEVCHRSLSELSMGIEALQPHASAMSVCVQVPSSMATLWLIPRLGDFYQLYPNIEVKLVTSPEWRLVDADLSIDVFLRCVSPQTLLDWNTHFGHEYLFMERIGVYAAPHFQWQTPQSSLIAVQFKDWVSESFSWQAWFQRYPNNALEGAPVRVFDTEHDAIQAAIAGYGVVLASDVLVSKVVAQGLLKPLWPNQSLPWPESYHALYRVGRQRHAAVAAWLRWLNEQARVQRQAMSV